MIYDIMFPTKSKVLQSKQPNLKSRHKGYDITCPTKSRLMQSKQQGNKTQKIDTISYDIMCPTKRKQFQSKQPNLESRHNEL